MKNVRIYGTHINSQNGHRKRWFVYKSYEAKVRTNKILKPIVFKLNRSNLIDV